MFSSGLIFFDTHIIHDMTFSFHVSCVAYQLPLEIMHVRFVCAALVKREIQCVAWLLWPAVRPGVRFGRYSFSFLQSAFVCAKNIYGCCCKPFSSINIYKRMI